MINAHLEEDFDGRKDAYESHRERVVSSLAKKLHIESNFDEVASCLAFAYRNDLADAILLADKLNFSQADMCALADDEISYWEAIQNESMA